MEIVEKILAKIKNYLYLSAIILMMKIGAVIPAFNAEREVGSVIDGIQEYLSTDIILVNDGSTDRTAKIVQSRGITVLSHEQNSGKGEALKTGFRKAIALNWDAVLTIDADGQHDPRFIPLFIDEFNRKRCEIIIGSRMANLHTMPFHRILSNKMTSALVSLRIGQKVIDSQSGYRLIKASVLKNITLTTSHYDTESELILKVGLKGYKIGFVNIDTKYQNAPSSIRLFLDTWRFVKLYCSSLFW